MKKGSYIIFISIFFLIIIAIILTIFKYSQAKYRKSDTWDYNYDTSGFYISSNFLQDTNYDVYNSHNNLDYTYITYLNFDTNALSFKVYNYQSDTQISKENIKYNISCEIKGEEAHTCFIDGSPSSKGNISLNKAYTCSVSGLTEEECKNNQNATLTYNKQINTHDISIQRASSSNSDTLIVNIILTVTYPYKKVLKGNLMLKYNEDEQGINIANISSSDYQCEYIVTNYGGATYPSVTLKGIESSVLFQSNNLTEVTRYMNKYDRWKVKVNKSKYIPCSKAIYQYTGTNYLFGDANNDGRANTLDVNRIDKHISGNELLTGVGFINADLNNDGAVNDYDKLLLQRYISNPTM